MEVWTTEVDQCGGIVFLSLHRKRFRAAGATHDPLHSGRTDPKHVDISQLPCWDETSARVHHHCNVSLEELLKILKVCDFGDFCDCDYCDILWHTVTCCGFWLIGKLQYLVNFPPGMSPLLCQGMFFSLSQPASCKVWNWKKIVLCIAFLKIMKTGRVFKCLTFICKGILQSVRCTILACTETAKRICTPIIRSSNNFGTSFRILNTFYFCENRPAPPPPLSPARSLDWTPAKSLKFPEYKSELLESRSYSSIKW